MVPACLTMALASCSGGSSSSHRAGGSSTGSTSSAPTTSTTQSSSGTTSAAGSTTCAVNNLALNVLGSGGAAGTLEVTLGLRNTATTSCTLAGYAGAQLLDASGKPLPTKVVRGGSYSFTNFAPTRVTVAGGMSAYFNVGYSDVPSGSQTTCSSASQIEITPPDDFTQLTTAFQATACNDGTLTFSPVFGSTSPETETTAPAHP